MLHLGLLFLLSQLLGFLLDPLLVKDLQAVDEYFTDIYGEQLDVGATIGKHPSFHVDEQIVHGVNKLSNALEDLQAHPL